MVRVMHSSLSLSLFENGSSLLFLLVYYCHRASLIVRVSAVLRGTVVGSSDWRFDNLGGSHHQSQVKSCCWSIAEEILCKLCYLKNLKQAELMYVHRTWWRGRDSLFKDPVQSNIQPEKLNCSRNEHWWYILNFSSIQANLRNRKKTLEMETKGIKNLHYKVQGTLR